MCVCVCVCVDMYIQVLLVVYYTQGEVELPPGWEKRLTNTGRVFFINHAHRITQWVSDT